MRSSPSQNLNLVLMKITEASLQAKAPTIAGKAVTQVSSTTPASQLQLVFFVWTQKIHAK
jgi:hypothetical protein